MTDRLPEPWHDTQIRYAAYCVEHGAASPSEMLERDRKTWPGGVMCGYLLWVRERWQAWAKATGWSGGSILTDEAHASFDAWIAEQSLTVLRPKRNEPPKRNGFWWAMGPTEVCADAAIYLDDESGGDPHVVCTLARVHRPDALDAALYPHQGGEP